MKKFAFVIISLCLLQIITKVNAQLVPSYRKLHSAVLVDKKLHIFGGFFEPAFNSEVDETQPNDRFFYLDVSKPFDTSNLPWNVVTDNAKNLPLQSLTTIAVGGVAASIGGANNSTIFFINSEKDPQAKKPAVLSYDTQNNLWQTQNPIGGRPIGRNQMRVVSNNGKIYLLAGFNVNVEGIIYTNAMFIFDTITLNCEIKTNPPISRLGYGATLLPSGIIVYMAGWDVDYVLSPNNFNQVYLYDTNKDEWNVKITTGNIPPSGAGISTVLGLDGNRIISFGGNFNSVNDLYVLDTTSYEWYLPKVKGRGPMFKRGEHTATVIGKYMVIAFGSNGISQFKYRSSGESDILLLDISNDLEYVWTTYFDPTPLQKADVINTPEKKKNAGGTENNKIILIGGITGSIVGISILSVSAIFLMRRRKRIKELKNVIPTPGNIMNGGTIKIPSENELSHGKLKQFTSGGYPSI